MSLLTKIKWYAGMIAFVVIVVLILGSKAAQTESTISTNNTLLTIPAH